MKSLTMIGIVLKLLKENLNVVFGPTMQMTRGYMVVISLASFADYGPERSITALMKRISEMHVRSSWTPICSVRK